MDSFIQSSDKDEELEDIGEEYIEENLTVIAIKCMILFTILHNMWLVRNERLSVKGENIVVIPERVRHVPFDSSLYCEFPKYLIKAKKLPMFLPSETGPNFGLSVEEAIPEKGIGGLTSLRIFLLLVNVELKSLGDGIQNLACLRELVIWGCPKLASLPAGFRHLSSLEHLEIRYCKNLELSEEFDLKGLKSLKKLVLNDSADALKNLTTLSESVLPNFGSFFDKAFRDED
ncbi:hypothetical protein RHGRI_006486 [Rhododendron griersonianum]|uniref:Uncharacterized protein n=1 Tax=Rhododendron griersonianum TaxID=479676 RepID=A0AAV6KT95_9ERIC|nr:hypothetical protein RHGRI_006486 [Rhododendron griersonianum]